MFPKYLQNVFGMDDLHGICLIYFAQEAVEGFLTHDLFCVAQEYRRHAILFLCLGDIIRKHIPGFVQIEVIQALQVIFFVIGMSPVTCTGIAFQRPVRQEWPISCAMFL